MNALLFLTAQIAITDTQGIAIRHCHAQDTALIEFAGHGWFTTTNTLLTLKSQPMTMLTNGEHVANIRTICHGATSGVTSVRFAIRRLPPAPIVTLGRELAFPFPPLPPGFVMPLPGGTNAFPTYEAYWRHSESGKHRSN